MTPPTIKLKLEARLDGPRPELHGAPEGSNLHAHFCYFKEGETDPREPHKLHARNNPLEPLH